MGKIVLLDDLTINKIAAGEVVERPASCVKEMVENSIDAGSKNITVEIKNGGISLIKIIDDGCGISEDDMEIAFERHATSKIRSAEDLEKVKTMGFRGEALASISAISNVEMISKRPEDEIGHKIVIEGGKVLEKGEIASPNGTTIIVKNLFFNTPVRYKFLKKDFTEAGYIEDAITRLALVNTNVAIKLLNMGKTVIQTIGNGDIKTVIYSIYGKDVSNGITEVDYTYEDIKVKGVVGNTDIARSNRNGQICFVNNRYVKDKTLSSAIDSAYKDILPVGKYGFAVLNIEIDPSKVDCNVHPAKLEVKFQDEQNVFKAIYHAIKSKNEDIVKVAKPVLEIKNQEKIENPENNDDGEIVDNKEKIERVKNDSFKPREGVFSGFFKRLKSNKEDETDEDNNSIIKDIFEAKKVGGLNWGKFDSEIDDEKRKDKEKIEELEKLEETIGPSEKKMVEENVNSSEDRKLEGTENSSEDRKLEGTENSSEDRKLEGIENSSENRELERTIDSSEGDKKIEETLNPLDEKKMEEPIRPLEEKKLEAKLGNTLITSDTREFETKTEVIESLKKFNEEINRETVIVDTENVRNENIDKNEDEKKLQKLDSEIPIEVKRIEALEDNTVTQRIIEQKVKNDMEDTQLVDTNEVRELHKLNQKDELNSTFTGLSKTSQKDDVPMTSEFANMYKKVFGTEVQAIRRIKEEEDEKLDLSQNIQDVENIENETVFEENNETKPRIKYRFIGTIFDDYAIIEVKDEMYMIEKSAAEERLMYEVVKENFYNEENKDSVTLLLADIITLTSKEMSMARELREMFNKSGFEFEEFGEYTLKLTKVPSWAESLNTKKLFLEILRDMDTVAVTATKEKEDKFISSVSSKYVLLSDTKLSESELEQLVKKLLTLSSPFMYPNGRLISVKITKANMEKKFSRR